MKTFHRCVRRLLGAALVSLGLVVGASGSQSPWLFSPGDDVGSMPSHSEEDTPSLMLVGSYDSLQDAVLDGQGAGVAYLRPITQGSETWVLEFEGSLTVRLDPVVLASERVTPFFASGHSFAGGSASIFALGEWNSVDRLSPFVYREMPLELLANTVSPTAVVAESLQGDRYSLVTRFDGEALVVRQHTRMILD